ncbi:WRKY transcription factor [Ancistrocladus abbreviatus]
MKETMALISSCCKLAMELDLNLPNLANHPDVLLQKIELLLMAEGARQQLLAGGSAAAGTTSMVGPQMLVGSRSPGAGTGTQQFANPEEPQRPPTDALHSGGGSSPLTSTPRTRKRKDDGETRVIRVRAPLIGNTEIPPEDGYTWRKYGQKEILNAIYPRAYYRCTHQKLYNCPAKKLVQRLNDSPGIFEITYRGNHICSHVSSTAPSFPLPTPPWPVATSDHMTVTTQQLMDTPTLHWLPMDFGMGGDGGAGPSDVRQGTEVDHPVHLADVMFNSGSSSSNSMELIFSPPAKDQCEPKDSQSN